MYCKLFKFGVELKPNCSIRLRFLKWTQVYFHLEVYSYMDLENISKKLQ